MQQTEWWVSKVKIVLFAFKTKLLILLVFAAFLSACNSDKINFSPGNLNSILESFHNTTSQKVLIAAHRASNTNYPENTLAAIEYSIKTGVDILEIDIRTTKDGKLVLLHDGTVNRTTNGEGKVSEFTYAELLELELDTKSGDTINHKIPLAEDALKLAYGKVMIDLDIKEVFIKQLVDLIHNTNTEKQVLFFDGSFDVLDSVLILDSTLMIMPRAHSLQDVNEIIERYHPPVIHIDPTFYTTEVVNTIKDGGARVWINALGKPDIKAKTGFVNAGYYPLIKNGANILQTDLPLTLHKYLQKNNLR
jgi:glycerophosphoryl diester phosphodiesterase